MRKKLVKHTSNFIAKETALIVFIILIIVAGLDMQKKLEAAHKTMTPEPMPDCVWTEDGHGVCQYGRIPGTMDQYRGN